MAFAALLLTPFRERRFACILSNSAYLTVFPRGPHQEHQHHLMNNRSVPNLEERLKHASEAEKLMLAKFKTSLVEGPAAIEKRQQRDHNVYFCRSDLNPADYIIWVRAANALSYLFLTDSGLKMLRAVHLKTAAFPEVLDVPTARI